LVTQSDLNAALASAGDRATPGGAAPSTPPPAADAPEENAA